MVDTASKLGAERALKAEVQRIVTRYRASGIDQWNDKNNARTVKQGKHNDSDL